MTATIEATDTVPFDTVVCPRYGQHKPGLTGRQKRAARKAHPRYAGEYDVKVAAIHKLRINIKSLAAEARAIRIEEQRCGLRYHAELHEHRVNDIRQQLRIRHLALAYLRGRTYRQVESGTPLKGAKGWWWARYRADIIKAIGKKLSDLRLDVSIIDTTRIAAWIDA